MGCLCATTPFFWPILQSGLNMIFVKYEFQVQSEARWQHDEHIELTSTTSTENKNFRDNVGSHYKDGYIENQVDPLGGEFSTKTIVKSGSQPGNLAGKKGAVQFVREV